MDDQPPLNPCPFCGNKLLISFDTHQVCPNCGAKVPHAMELDEPASHWEARLPEGDPAPCTRKRNDQLPKGLIRVERGDMTYHIEPAAPADIMTVHELALYLKTSDGKVYRMARTHDLPAFRIGKSWRFKKHMIDRWISQRTDALCDPAPPAQLPESS